jgi:hypothetical protein
MKTEDCINIAKKSRGVLFTEKFGEIISDNLYDYLRDDLHISVLCLTKKSTIVLVVAAENKDVLEYINFFAKQYKSQGAATMDESN